MLLKKNFKLSAFLSATVLLLSACSSNGCYEDMSVKLYANFYTFNLLGKAVAVQVDSLTVRGIGSDSILYKNRTLSGFELDLNPNAPQTQFLVTAQQNGYLYTDTLTFEHHNKPWFQSMECGCRVFSTLDGCRVRGNIFKSAVVLDSSVINLKSEHVRLYL
ncbi:MAG TPA: DUF6452 family protein [Bacteroidales bacterium]|nr:DUF6452 family protein [Bacteroidales bacterium]